MSAGAKAGPADPAGLTNEINVTPMIDVLLVLLIVFMLAVQKRMAIDLQQPVPQPPCAGCAPDDQRIVLEVRAGGVFALNRAEVPRGALAERLRATYAGRPEKVLFVRGDSAVKYQEVFWAMDVARGAGVKVIGAVPKTVGRP